MLVTLHPSFAIHPGPWLRAEIIEPHGLNVSVAGRKLHVTRPAFRGRRSLSIHKKGAAEATPSVDD